ncbi:MAG TPA: polysaccharide biosynthesis/export family protein [Pedobacter sp.]|nr:polysaccharide biosynthesis/export family protein [Pedobacter sp.]
MPGKLVTLSIIAIVCFSSCGSYKNIPYFQELKTENITEETVTNFSPLTIQPGDILEINVSSRNPESSAIFNKNLTQISGLSASTTSDIPGTGYEVDEEGFIYLPLIGKYEVKGISISALRKQLSEKMISLYKDPVVNIRILNFRISVYGDVLKPNIYTIQGSRITITQALTLAGDLNITAMRNRIFLIRDEAGKRKYIPIDLTTKNLFQSPYFYLKNNDEIYVQPDKTKYATVDRGYRTATLVLSGLSIIAIVLSNLYR